MRLEMKLSQSELGEKISRSERTIQRYESGETPVPKLVYDAVERLYNAEVGMFDHKDNTR